MKPFFLSLLLVWTSLSACFGQADTTRQGPYQVHRVPELASSVGFLGLSYVGFRQLDRTATLSADQVARLDPSQINAFDRPSAFLDPTRFEAAQHSSDLFLNLSIASPLLLLAASGVRRDWLDVLTLYTVSHAINNVLYFGTAFPVRRARPLTYNTGLPIEAKTGQAKSNSFYSGHVSFSTTATFFAAKVLTDYYHIRGWQRVGVFAVAAVPPALVGLNRIQAGKHFRTDVLTGFLVGAACGIGVPQLHKLVRRTNRLSWQPELMPNGGKGIRFTYSI